MTRACSPPSKRPATRQCASEMRTATRIGLFLAGAAAVFAVAFGAARILVPADASAAWASQEDEMQAHDTATTNAGGRGAATSASPVDDVRGLSVSHAGAPPTDYDRAHDKALHLIVVRTDGTEFRHVPPVVDGAGSWTIPWSWN